MKDAPSQELSRAEMLKMVEDMQAVVVALRGENAALREENAALKARLAEMEMALAKARKNSSNSSKPPSSDIVKPPKPPNPDGGKRKIGGQPGHVKHERPPFSPDEIDGVVEYSIQDCPDCGGALILENVPPRTVQQVEIEVKPIFVTEYRAGAYRCSKCGGIHYARIPDAVMKAGLAGPKLTAMVAYLKGVCRMSYTQIRKYLRDVSKFKVSRGQLRKVVSKVGESLAAPYADLLSRLSREPIVNADETGHKENGERMWTWVFRALDFCVFKIDKSRGSQVIWDVLGEDFSGVLGADYFSAYRKYVKDCGVLIQFCLAHLIRDLKYLSELPDKAAAEYGEKLLDGMRELFGILHIRDELDEATFDGAMRQLRADILKIGIEEAPDHPDALNMRKRFVDHGDSYFTFVTTPGIDPTNNVAEQALRFVVLDRAMTQGTRSESGRKWCERIWTAISTCAIQGKSAYEYLVSAVDAFFNNSPIPTLLPDST